MFDNRDFTVCKNCGGNCYIGNKYCEDCANEILVNRGEEIRYLLTKRTEDHELIRCSDYYNEILTKALELACNDIYWLSYMGGNYTKEDFVKHKVDLYMKKAKEKMKSE